MDLHLYRVNAGAQLSHEGQVLAGGAEVELPPHVGFEVRHLVTPIDRVTKKEKPWGTADQAALETELAKARPHERVSLIEAAIAQHKGEGDHLQQLLAAAKREEAEAAKVLLKKSEKPAPAPEAGDKK